MHSKDTNKGAGDLFEAFWREFEMIVEAAGKNEAHFEGFSFPKLDLVERRFEAICRFEGAIFTLGANFRGAIFTKDADFKDAIFTKDADFIRATFTQRAYFTSATFTQRAYFSSATFRQNANFRSATFTQAAYFNRATFTQAADFSRATFGQIADFFRATFGQDANFRRAAFTKDAVFFRVTFTRSAAFVVANFMKDAFFSDATFRENADFGQATFTKHAAFEGTVFRGTASWEACHFLESAAFRHTTFDPQLAGVASGVFASASLAYPRKIIFDDVDLSRTSFLNCDVSEVWFTTSARWAERGSRGVAVFEESVPPGYVTGLERDGERDYRAIAQIYQQLKKNYDTRLNYWTANEFHFGEMEMKRLVAPTEGRLLWLWRWMHPWLSVTAWYRYASDYGNSYRKPMLWFLAVLLLFAGLFPLPGVGLRRSGATYSVEETYSSAWRLGSSMKQKFQGESKLVGKSMLVAVDTATFQRNPEYAPVYPWGRVLAIAETLLTSTLFGLFLLAIRRQFRR